MRDSPHQKDSVRLNFEFPMAEYPHLKMVLASKRVSLRDFTTALLLKAIEEAEDDILAAKAKERLEKQKSEDLVTWDEATQLAGWENEAVQTPLRKKVSKRPRKNPATSKKKH